MGHGYLPDIEDILNHMTVNRVVYPGSARHSMTLNSGKMNATGIMCQSLWSSRTGHTVNKLLGLVRGHLYHLLAAAGKISFSTVDDGIDAATVFALVDI